MYRKKVLAVTIIIFSFAGILVTLVVLKQKTDNFTHASPPDQLETEGGVLSGNAIKQTDSNASGGQYILFGVNGSQNQTGIGPQAVNSTPLSQGTKFVSTTGTGTTCTQTSPCALSQAISSATAGDVVFMRGGTYPITTILQWNNNGTASNYITFESYPGESAILDGSNQPNNSQRMMRVGGNYYKFRKFEIKNMPDIGFYITGSNNILDGLNVNHNRNSGIYIIGGNNNLIQNSIANDNSDAGLTGGNYDNGGNADGIGISSGDSNKVLNSITARNSDDGTDAWTSTNTIISYSISTANGLGNGDGNGFKLGGPSPSNGTHIDHSISYQNKVTGFDANSGPNVVINFVTSWNNGAYGIFPVASTTVTNSISVNNTSGNTYANGTQTNNSWQRSGTPAFISTDPTSTNFLKPTVGGGFEDIGAYAGLSQTVTSVPNTPISTLTPTNSQIPTPTSTNTTYDAVFTGDATGTNDVTVALKNFLESNSGKRVALAVNGIYKVSQMSITTNNLSLDFRGARIVGSQEGAHGIFRMNDCTNIVLNNPIVYGTASPFVWIDADQYEHGISVNGGTNITINNPYVRNVRGDGVYINYSSSYASPIVIINNPDIAYAARNAISPVAGTVSIYGGKVTHTGLHGIDFESNDTAGSQSIKGIVSGVDFRNIGELSIPNEDHYAIAAGGDSTGKKQSMLIQNNTGSLLNMTIRNTLDVRVKNNSSDTQTQADFPGSTVNEFTNNVRITKI